RCWPLSGSEISSKPSSSARRHNASVSAAGSSFDSESPKPAARGSLMSMWISFVPYEQADGPLRDSYDRQARALGTPTELTLAGPLPPPLVDARLQLYAATERCPSSLTAHQRNLISFVTSALNGTPYCMSQVAIKLRQTGLTDSDIAALAADHHSVGLASA